VAVIQILSRIGCRFRLGQRHQPSGCDQVVVGNHLTFADYVARTRNILQGVHSRIVNDGLEKIVDGNAPFELKPSAVFLSGGSKAYRRGVLLTHGLSDSPYLMRHLAAFFQENGFRVMAVCLPGHGTQPGDLLDVSWREWVKMVAYGVDRLSEEVENVYLGGFSAGGALSVYQSLRDKRVNGLFLFSPAIRITPWAALAKFHKFYSWLVPYWKWLAIKPDHDIYKYESFPINAAVQVYALTKEIKRLLHRQKMAIPVFVACSEDDITVDTSATLGFVAQAHHPGNRIVLYTTKVENHSVNYPAIDPTISELHAAGKLELVNSVFPEQRILSSSHTAIALPESDTHYGASGTYSSCSHYHPGNLEKFSACNDNVKNIFQGELTTNNLKAGIVRRLTYNPNYSELLTSMKEFIDSLP